MTSSSSYATLKVVCLILALSITPIHCPLEIRGKLEKARQERDAIISRLEGFHALDAFLTAYSDVFGVIQANMETTASVWTAVCTHFLDRAIYLTSIVPGAS